MFLEVQTPEPILGGSQPNTGFSGSLPKWASWTCADPAKGDEQLTEKGFEAGPAPKGSVPGGQKRCRWLESYFQTRSATRWKLYVAES